MQPSFERLTTPTIQELEQIRAIYETNFPLSERKPFDDIRPRLESGEYICLVAKGAEEPRHVVAFALFLMLPTLPLAYLEYLAVDQRYHGLGIGSGLLRAAGAYFQESVEGMVWEVEPAINSDPTEDRNRRIRFYERLGAKLIELSSVYAMPNYETGRGGVPLRLMQLPMERQPEKDAVSAMVRGIYEVAYPEWVELRDEILEGLK